jgi:hypothetical protein
MAVVYVIYLVLYLKIVRSLQGTVKKAMPAVAKAASINFSIIFLLSSIHVILRIIFFSFIDSEKKK